MLKSAQGRVSQRGRRSSLRWPVRLVSATGTLCVGTDALAVAIAAMAVDECVRYRRADRAAGRKCDRLARNVRALVSALEDLSATASGAADASEHTRAMRATLDALTVASEDLKALRPARDALGAARRAWAAYVLLPRDGMPASPTPYAYTLATEMSDSVQTYRMYGLRTQCTENFLLSDLRNRLEANSPLAFRPVSRPMRGKV
jgi:hypothetical protein